MTLFFTVDGLGRAERALTLPSGAAITGLCRRVKTPAALAFIQRGRDITLGVQKAAARSGIRKTDENPPKSPNRRAPQP